MKLSSRSRLATVVALALALLSVGGAAWSYWTSAGAGAASATVATLAPPSITSATASGDTVSITWTGPTPPGGGTLDGYYLQRSTGTAGGTCASSSSSLLAATSTGCSDTGVASGTYAYTLVAVFRSWSSSATSAPVTVAAATPHHFQVTAPAAATAGTAFDVTVTAQDASNATLASYSGAKAVTWSGPSAAPNGSTPSYPGSVTFAGGVGTASVTLVKAETTTLTATEGSVTGTSAGIATGAGAAAQFTVGALSPQTAGTSFNVALTALDAYQNTATSYAGPKPVVWSGPATSPSGSSPSYPASVSFTNGVGSAPVTLVRAETTTVTATHGSVTGSSGPVVVGAGAAARLAWTGASATPGTIGSPCLFTCTATGNNNTITAKVSATDAQGNTVSNLGAGHTVTVATPTSGAGSGGSFTAPTSGTSVTLTIAGTGPADSTQAFSFKTQNGSWTTNTFGATKATGAAYTSAAFTATKS